MGAGAARHRPASEGKLRLEAQCEKLRSELELMRSDLAAYRDENTLLHAELLVAQEQNIDLEHRLYDSENELKAANDRVVFLTRSAKLRSENSLLQQEINKGQLTARKRKDSTSRPQARSFKPLIHS